MGTEGTLILGGTLRFIPEHVNEGNGWIVDSWPEKLAQAYYEDPAILHEERPFTRNPGVLAGEEIYRAEGRNSLIAHFEEFFAAIRNGTPTREDATVGHHAASCAHMINTALDRETIVHWDAEHSKLVAN